MLNETDMMNRLEVEQLRRSVAMLPPGANAFNREDGLQILAAVLTLLENDDDNRWMPRDDRP